MTHIIAHIIHDDGKHELWNFDDEGMTISYEAGEVRTWSGTPTPTAITFSGSGGCVAVESKSLDDGIAKLVAYLTKRANDAERDAKAAESRARNARAAERASILALLRGNGEDELEGGCDSCSFCDG